MKISSLGLRTCITFLALFSLSGNAANAPTLIRFLKGGKEVKSLNLSAPPAELKTSEMKVHEPHEDREKVYVGYRTPDLLKWAYGSDWKNAEEVLFTCTDGYQPSVPSEFLTKYETLFATSVKGQKEFVVHNKMQNEKSVPLGPLYLVWNNLKDTELRANGASWWPYQVVTVDLVKFNDRFAATAPPKRSSKLVKAGFVFFRYHCMSCHAINGEGGQKGPDLNFPVSLIRKYGEEKMRGIIMNPRKYNPNSKMAGFEDDPNYKGRLKEIDAQLPNLFSYLRAISH